MTPTVASLPDGLKEKVVEMVREFTEFAEGDLLTGQVEIPRAFADDRRGLCVPGQSFEGFGARAPETTAPVPIPGEFRPVVFRNALRAGTWSHCGAKHP